MRKTILTIGQDLFSIEEYVNSFYNASLHENRSRYEKLKNAAAFMFYTDIQELKGLDIPVDYGSGIEYADGLDIDAIQIGLWLNGTSGCQDIVDGKLDARIDFLYDYIEASHFHKVYLRVGYEFDNPDFGYDDPDLYATAFRYIASKEAPDKVDFVWHSWAASLIKPEGLNAYYPGNKYVDWVGISVFSQIYATPLLGNTATIQCVLDFAESIQKPLMIAESTPFGGIGSLEDPIADWFQPVLDLIESNDVGMWSYINCDWESQPMWNGVGFGNTLLSSNASVLHWWEVNVLRNDRFILDSGLQHSAVENNAHVWFQQWKWVAAVLVLMVSLIVLVRGMLRKPKFNDRTQSIRYGSIEKETKSTNSTNIL